MNRASRISLFIGLAGLLIARGAAAEEDTSLTVGCDPELPRLFGGARGQIEVRLSNHGSQPTEIEARYRLLQLSSATAVPWSEAPWKRIPILAGQTLIESFALDLPSVRVETRFLVQWFDGTRRFGSTPILVYPTNLLSELGSISGPNVDLGLWDPGDELKPLLLTLGVEFVDLEQDGLEGFRGRLAIIRSSGPDPDGARPSAREIRSLIDKGVNLVWIRPITKRGLASSPGLHTFRHGIGTLMLLHPDLVGGLTARPESQLTLLDACRLAVGTGPDPWRDWIEAY
jgi:hypothetical protein